MVTRVHLSRAVTVLVIKNQTMHEAPKQVSYVSDSFTIIRAYRVERATRFDFLGLNINRISLHKKNIVVFDGSLITGCFKNTLGCS